MHCKLSTYLFFFFFPASNFVRNLGFLCTCSKISAETVYLYACVVSGLIIRENELVFPNMGKGLIVPLKTSITILNFGDKSIS